MKLEITKNEITHVLYVHFQTDYFNINHAGKLFDKPRLGIACQVEFPNYDGDIHFGNGEAFCAPMDKFNKSRGRTLALSRALSEFTFLNHDDRKSIFDALRAKGVKIG